jgi:hypothetical protein
MKYLMINESNEICVTNNRDDAKEFSGGYAVTVINLGNLTLSGGEKIPEYAPQKIRLQRDLERIYNANTRREKPSPKNIR